MGGATGFFGSPVFYAGPKGPRVYAWAHNDVLKSWDVSTTTVPKTPADQSAASSVTYLPGAMLSVSANGNTMGTGIVWATTSLNGPAGGTEQQGALLAYDASNLTKQLYSSQVNSKQDSPGLFGKFNPPTIAAGKVFVGTFSNVVAVYGLK